MLKATPHNRKKMNQEVEILDDMMQSRWDTIHGKEGLCSAVIELFHAMAEIRMKAEYGDYLAYTCAALRTETMNDMKWKIDKCDWQEVAQMILKEERTKADEELRRFPVSPTPYLDDIAKAASRLGHDINLVRYQIIAYAERNNFCHSGIKVMIDYGEFQQLAERIVEDKRALGVIFQGRPEAQIEMRSVIKIVEKEWFRSLYVDAARNSLVKFVPTEKAIKKMERRAARQE